MANVYVVPDDLIPAIQDWQHDDVLNASFSGVTGFVRASQIQRRRLVATLTYAPKPRDLGRLEVLRDAIKNGLNYLQMTRRPVYFRQTASNPTVTWQNGSAAAVTWNNDDPAPVTFTSRGPARSIYAVDGQTYTVRGFEPGAIVCIAGELIERLPASSWVARCIDTVTADASGVAVIPTDGAQMRVGNLVQFGSGETVIMQSVAKITIPRSASGLDEPVTLQLRQVFTDEIGETTTINLWA